MVNCYIDRDPATGKKENDDFADSISIQDRITHGNFVTTLGVRYEDVDYDKITKNSWYI